jgi:hypothetical protein
MHLCGSNFSTNQFDIQGNFKLEASLYDLEWTTGSSQERHKPSSYFQVNTWPSQSSSMAFCSAVSTVNLSSLLPSKGRELYTSSMSRRRLSPNLHPQQDSIHN